MLVISCRMAQSAALVFKMNVSCITTPQSVLTFISQHIWIKIGIVLSILIIFEIFRTGKSCMWIRISGQQIDDFSRLSSGSVTGWGGWRAWRRWRGLWNPLSVSGGWRCTCSFTCPACLQILCGAIWARKAAGRLVFTKHCRVSLYSNLHLIVPRKLNTPLLFFSDLGAWFLYEIFRFLNCGAQKPSLAILAIFNARRMSDCSSCPRPPCLVIVADMMKTYKTLVDASNNEIRLLPLPYTLL